MDAVTRLTIMEAKNEITALKLYRETLAKEFQMATGNEEKARIAYEYRKTTKGIQAFEEKIRELEHSN